MVFLTYLKNLAILLGMMGCIACFAALGIWLSTLIGRWWGLGVVVGIVLLFGAAWMTKTEPR